MGPTLQRGGEEGSYPSEQTERPELALASPRTARAPGLPTASAGLRPLSPAASEYLVGLLCRGTGFRRGPHKQYSTGQCSLLGTHCPFLSPRLRREYHVGRKGFLFSLPFLTPATFLYLNRGTLECGPHGQGG